MSTFDRQPRAPRKIDGRANRQVIDRWRRLVASAQRGDLGPAATAYIMAAELEQAERDQRAEWEGRP